MGFKKRLCAILEQSLIFFHSSFWHFTRRQTGKGVPDTQNAFFRFSTRNGWLDQK
jgi:hypothetical protein